MILTIDNKEVSFKFGIGFLRELDKRHGLIKDGGRLGMALAMRYPALSSGDLTVLSEFLYLANQTENVKVSQADIDNFLDTSENIEEVLEKTLLELESSNGGKLVIKTIKSKMEKQGKLNHL